MSDVKLTELESLERLIAADARNLATIRQNARLYMAADVARIAADCALRFVTAIDEVEDGDKDTIIERAHYNLAAAAELWAQRRG